MTHRQKSQRGRRSGNRRVWVFSQLNHDLSPEHYMKVIVLAGLEQARLEADAQQQAQPEPGVADAN